MCVMYVMSVEVPGSEIIIGVIVAFGIGMGVMFGWYKMNGYFVSQMGAGVRMDRLEYYERQLIDLKIRLDALAVSGGGAPEHGRPDGAVRDAVVDAPKPVAERAPADNTLSDYASLMDRVLHIITNGPMTSRDMQITLKKSREHTSRLLKRLFEDGYVERSTESKPYTYTITEKGLSRLNG